MSSTALLPAEHQLRCPFALLEVEQPRPVAQGIPGAPATFEQLTCPDRRCCTWLDLHTWFGLDAPELPVDEFRIAFTDIAHGGSGIYEKLVVLGTRALELFAEVYVNEQFDPTGIPIDLLNGKLIPEEVTRKVWTRKRVERLLTPHALWTFAKAYLSTAQALPSETSCVKFVRACVGYSVQLPHAEAQQIFSWMPSLVEHIYWSQRLQVEDHDEDNEMLQDIQEYFGYPYSKLIPRVRESLKVRSGSSQPPTGNDILRFYAFDYFRGLSEESKIPHDQRASWVEDETQEFMRSLAAPLFAGCWLNLSPFIAISSTETQLPNSLKYLSMFKSLLAACYILSSEDKARVWMGALVHRLRQIQLLLRLRYLDILAGGPTADLEYLKGVDIHRWSSLSHLLQTRRLGWMEAGLDDISIACLGDKEPKLPSASKIVRDALDHDQSHRIKENVKRYQLGVNYGDDNNHHQHTFFNQLKQALLPCLRDRREVYPIKLIDPESPDRKPLELYPVGMQNRFAGPEAGTYYDFIHTPRAHNEENKESFWKELERVSNPFKSERHTMGHRNNHTNNNGQSIIMSEEAVTKNQARNQPQNVGRIPVVFRRSRQKSIPPASSTKKNPSCRFGLPHGYPKDIWPTVPRDKHGTELWRAPGAIFMKPKQVVMRTDYRQTLPSDSIYSNKNNNEALAITQNRPNGKFRTEFSQSSPPIGTTTTSFSKPDLEDDAIRMKLRYNAPIEQKQRPLHVVFYDDEESKRKKNPALTAVLNTTKNSFDQNTDLFTKQKFQATIYTHNSDYDKPIHLDFVPTETTTGTPNIYISGYKNLKAHGTMITNDGIKKKMCTKNVIKPTLSDDLVSTTESSSSSNLISKIETSSSTASFGVSSSSLSSETTRKANKNNNNRRHAISNNNNNNNNNNNCCSFSTNTSTSNEERSTLFSADKSTTSSESSKQEETMTSDDSTSFYNSSNTTNDTSKNNDTSSMAESSSKSNNSLPSITASPLRYVPPPVLERFPSDILCSSNSTASFFPKIGQDKTSSLSNKSTDEILKENNKTLLRWSTKPKQPHKIHQYELKALSIKPKFYHQTPSHLQAIWPPPPATPIPYNCPKQVNPKIKSVQRSNHQPSSFTEKSSYEFIPVPATQSASLLCCKNCKPTSSHQKAIHLQRVTLKNPTFQDQDLWEKHYERTALPHHTQIINSNLLKNKCLQSCYPYNNLKYRMRRNRSSTLNAQ